MRTKALVGILLVFNLIILHSCINEQQEPKYREKYRLQFHFSPPSGWMNDPNGLVWYEGEYHLFYQYYPDSTVWGPMHWGHAVSSDLVHWKNLPVALYPDSLGYIFSGSAVTDWKNRSGLQAGQKPPVIAIFTHHSSDKARSGRNDFEYQSLAFSNDSGRTFTKYSHNPVVPNPGERDFRDPKVTWIGELNKWVMVLAAGQKVRFYGSENLLDWEFLSEFGTGAGAHGGVWECPDLFQMNADGINKWVLIVNINPGGPNGGSGTQYFTGIFDGHEFTSDNPPDTTLWLDYGPDNYAGVTWSDIPQGDGRRIMIGWMSNWSYAQKTPTESWRSSMTVPRKLKLLNTRYGLRLCAYPVAELISLRNGGGEQEAKNGSQVSLTGLNEIILKADLNRSNQDTIGIVVENSLGQKLIVGFERKSNRYFIDRTKSGKTEFSPVFGKVSYAPRISDQNLLKMHVLLDRSSVEVFCDDGLTVMTGLFFPDREMDRLTFCGRKGNDAVSAFSLYNLKSAR